MLPLGQRKHGARFASFEVDLRTGELRNRGFKVRLQRQPSQILTLLLARPGEVVTREELRLQLWRDETFVDFEHGLNRAINRLRTALGDSADHPRFIETLPKVGYRFLAPVEWLEQPPEKPKVETIRLVPSPEAQARPARGRRAWTVGLLFLALVVAAVAWFRWVYPQLPHRAAVPKLVPFTSFVGKERAPAFSPDGTMIAFQWDGDRPDNYDDYDIYVQYTDTAGAGPPRRLTTDPADELAPRWSPDGRHIAFSRESGSGRDIFIVPALGGPERKLGHTLVSHPFLDWSPDGSLLAIADSYPEDTHASIFLLSVETGVKRKLTSPPAPTSDGWPEFSPDGRTLAFRRSLHGRHDLYLVPVAGGEPSRLTFEGSNINGLAWTSGGRDIVFSSNRTGDFRLWRIPASGGKPAPVAGAGPDASTPAISRQGRWLAYTQRSLDRNIWRIRLMPPLPGKGSATGVSPPAPLIASTRGESTPQFSPDGRKIAFASNRSGAWEIWASDSEGQNPVQLTTLGGMSESPRWSADGHWIAFHSYVGGNADIYVIGAEGGPPRRLTTAAEEELVPSWSRDGRWVYFYAKGTVWKMPAGGGPVVQATTPNGFAPSESPDGKFVYYVKGRYESGILRVPVGSLAAGTPVLDDLPLDWGQWALVERGIYYVNVRAKPQTIEFFEFATGRRVRIATLPKELEQAGGGPALAVSPDQRSILYTQVDRWASDIMLVENFR